MSRLTLVVATVLFASLFLVVSPLPLPAQRDSLPVAVTARTHFEGRFLKDRRSLDALLARIDSIKKVHGSKGCIVQTRAHPCAIIEDTLSWDTFALHFWFFAPFTVSGRRQSLLLLTPSYFGRSSFFSPGFEVRMSWVPARMTAGGLDSVRNWYAPTGIPGKCSRYLHCLQIVHERWGLPAGSIKTLSECHVLMDSTGGVPIGCYPLAVWDRYQWWVRGIVGYTISNQELDGPWVVSVTADPFDFIIQGPIARDAILLAAERALSTIPQPYLQTTQRTGVVVGRANRRVSPVLSPYREIVDVFVVVSSEGDDWNGVMIYSNILVNRYNDSADRSYHLPSRADEQRYTDVLRSTIRAQFTRLCQRPLWNAQVLRCNE